MWCIGKLCAMCKIVRHSASLLVCVRGSVSILWIMYRYAASLFCGVVRQVVDMVSVVVGFRYMLMSSFLCCRFFVCGCEF